MWEWITGPWGLVAGFWIVACIVIVSLRVWAGDPDEDVDHPDHWGIGS